MSVENTTFDPYAHAWRAYDEGGLDGLRQVEAPLFVYEPDPADVAKLPVDWNSPNPVLTGHDLRFMILPDAFPVSPNHLNVAGGRPVPYWEATDAEQHILDTLLGDTERHLRRVLSPPEGVSVQRFGKVPTLHGHVIPRMNWEDGLDWTGKREKISVDQRHAVAESLQLSDDQREVLRERATQALRRFIIA